jgi:hypothetical protein
MKKILLCITLLLSGCVQPVPQPTMEQYCGEKLGLQYGTKEYAKCGMVYSALLVEINKSNQEAANQRYAIWQNAVSASQPTNINVHYGY